MATISLVEILTSDPSAPFENRGSMTFQTDTGKGKGAGKMLVIWEVYASWAPPPDHVAEAGTPPVSKDGITKFYYRNGLDETTGTPLSQSWKAYLAADVATYKTPVSNVLEGTF